MTRFYREVVATIRDAIHPGDTHPDRLREAIRQTEIAAERARNAGDGYLASKFQRLGSDLDYLVQLMARNRKELLDDRHDIILAECTMVETHITDP